MLTGASLPAHLVLELLVAWPGSPEDSRREETWQIVCPGRVLCPGRCPTTRQKEKTSQSIQPEPLDRRAPRLLELHPFLVVLHPHRKRRQDKEAKAALNVASVGETEKGVVDPAVERGIPNDRSETFLEIPPGTLHLACDFLSHIPERTLCPKSRKALASSESLGPESRRHTTMAPPPKGVVASFSWYRSSNQFNQLKAFAAIKP